jgi:hypothetical protein
MSLSRSAVSGIAAFLFALAGSAADPTPVVVKIGNLSAPAPAEWKAEKPKFTLRSYQFSLPGDSADATAELIVLPNSNPDPEKAYPRWKAMFEIPEGKTSDDIGKVSKFESAGATYHVFDVTGTWKYKDFPQAKKEEIRPDSRVVWVIVVGKDETTHLRLSGPKDVVGKHYPAFEAWLKALK